MKNKTIKCFTEEDMEIGTRFVFVKYETIIDRSFIGEIFETVAVNWPLISAKRLTAKNNIGFMSVYQFSMHECVLVTVDNGYSDSLGVKPKNAWEVAPDGYRLVTDEERDEFDYPTDCIVQWTSKTNGGKWIQPSGSTWGCVFNPENLAVPTSYTFEKPVKKMTVAEIAEKLGYDVEIVK